MNTDFLVWNNTDIYENFFNKYDLIISTPIHFPIIWDTSIFWNGNWYSISQKIPLRNYIWINLNKKLGKIDFIYKNNSKTEFEIWNIENFYQIDETILKEIWLNFEIWFLSEYNWNDPSSFISNILVAILLINKKLKVDDLEKLDINNPEYNKILDKIIELDNELIEKYDFFSNIRNNSSFIWSCILKSNSHILNIFNNNKIEYKNIWEYNDFNQLDLSISIINTNTFFKTHYNTKLILEFENSLKTFCDNTWIKFWDSSFIDSLERLSKFYSLKVYKDLHWLYNNNIDWSSFFQDVHAYRQILKSIFNSFLWNSLDIKKIRDIMLSYLPYNYINIFIDQIWACWDSKIIVFSNKVWLVDEEYITKVNWSIWLNMTLDYSSFYDWYKREWLVLEQYKTKWIYSRFCSWINILKYYWNNIEKININKEDLFLLKNSLILSKLDNKIYLNWVQLTSKDLNSQDFTIKLFEILFNNNWNEIKNIDLPFSSYSKSKNEFMWKIILPLKKILDEKNSKSFKIECYGSLEKFSIKLIKSDVNIHLLTNN